MSQIFKRRRENFLCENCAEMVIGDGYTNHCPRCLWSKHVDITPGDRLNNCRAPMEPVDLVFAKNEFVIVHRCLGCGVEKTNRAARADNLARLLTIDRPVII